MRIIAGQYGGRRLEVPKGRDIRPTSDKVRGSIFNALGSRTDLDGAQALDLFCGTGALGLEALSRGASGCTFIDKARESLDLAKRNAGMLEDDFAAEFILADASILKARTANLRKADIFFCDPPYNLGLIKPCLEGLKKGDWLAKGAIGVLEAEKNWHTDLPQGWEILSEKTYGDTKIIFVRSQ